MQKGAIFERGDQGPLMCCTHLPFPGSIFFFCEQIVPCKRAYLFVYLAQCFAVMLLPDGVLFVPFSQSLGLACRGGHWHSLDKPCSVWY